MLNIDSLDSGIVIDHIKAGSSMEIYRYLRLDQLDCCVAIIKNAKSNKYGKKDIIKIEGITEINTDILGLSTIISRWTSSRMEALRRKRPSACPMRSIM